MDADRTVVVLPRYAWVMVWVVVPLGCGASYWLLRFLTMLLSNLYWLPLPDWVQVAAVLREPFATIVAVTAGLGIGLRMVYRDHKKAPELTVTADVARFKRAGKLVGEFPRSAVTAVFHDLNHLNLLSGRAELSRFACELDVEELKKAFLEHNWPWLEQDPYLDDYQAGNHLNSVVNDLLATRGKVLYKNDYWGAVEIRTALARLGVVVRDTADGRQLWRAGPHQRRRDGTGRPRWTERSDQMPG